MIALDNDALIAAFQINSPPAVVAYREAIRRFIIDRGNGLFMAPSVVLAEYLFKFDTSERQQEFTELLNRHVHIPAFDQLAAEVASDLGRRFITETPGRTLSSVARAYGADRFVLKADLQIVATAICNQATALLTGDTLTKVIADFAGLEAHLLTAIPAPPPPPPPPPRRDRGEMDLFATLSPDDLDGPILPPLNDPYPEYPWQPPSDSGTE